MKGDERRAAVAAYKERKAAVGIYAIRCAADGATWVGGTPNLGTIQNRIWFTLRHGSHSQPRLQKAWHDHGADAFTFEVLEQFDEEASAYVRDANLRGRAAHWRSVLAAQAL